MNQQVTKQHRSLQIVQAFSEVNVPESLYQGSNVSRLVQNLKETRDGVKSSNERLGKLRTEKENQAWYEVLSPFGDSTAEKIEEEHLTLNRRLATLAQHSSELLVVNTALSKVLCDQQQLLLDQQGALARQSEDIKDQNGRIQDGQEQLAAFQARQLASNDALGMRMQAVANRLAELAQRVVNFEQAVASAHARTLEAMDERLAELQEAAEHDNESLRVSVNRWRSESDRAIQALVAEQRLADSRLAEQRERAHRDHEAAWTAIDGLNAGRRRDLGSLTERLAALVSEQSVAQARMAALDARLDVLRRVISLAAVAVAAATGIATWLATRL